MTLYPILYQDSVDLEGDNDDIITLLTPPEQRLLQSILNNVESNPDIFIADYFEQDTDIVDSFLANLMAKLMGEPVVSGWSYGRQRLFPDGNDGIGGTLTWSSVPTENNAGLYVIGGGQGASVLWSKVALKKGTYRLDISARRGNSFGIVTLYVDGVSKTTRDLYNSTTIAATKLSTTTFTISVDGIYDVEIQMATKNASSSGYAAQFQWVDLIRTGD